MNLINKTIIELEYYNKWRRGEDIEQPNPSLKYCNSYFQINKVIELKKHIFFLLVTCLCLCILSVILFEDNHKQTERLNEQKRLLIAQQEQINQLILNAKQNELNRK